MRRAALISSLVAELAKSFGLHFELPKALAASATAGLDEPNAHPHLQFLGAAFLGLFFVWNTDVGVGQTDSNPKPDVPFSLPAKIVPASTSSESEMASQMMLVRERPQPTLPDGKLPNYQIGFRLSQEAHDRLSADGKLRMLITLPDEPLLAEFELFVDGVPFPQKRANRVTELLKEIDLAAEPSTDQSELAEEPDPGVEKSEEATDQVTEAGPEGESAEESDSEVSPPTVAEYSQPTNAKELIQRYALAVGNQPTSDEVHWLLENRIDGPTLLFLTENFQQFRADQRPAFDVLDRNGDGTISADEIAMAAESLRYCDLNRDEVVTYTEVAEIATDPKPRAEPKKSTRVQLFPIDAATLGHRYRELAAIYGPADDGTRPSVPRFDRNKNGQFDPEEIANLNESEPDMRMTVRFNTEKPDESKLTLSSFDERQFTTVPTSAANSAITMRHQSANISVTALHGPASDQISIGLVSDGYPLMPALDPYQDGRYTTRELRSIVDRLKEFDRDGDGAISSVEAGSTIRICIGLGAVVHSELAGIRSLTPKSTEPMESGPEWFVRMDRNKDNDLARGEFPGTDEQFATLDADGDELISALEANQFENQTKDKPTP